MSHRTPLWELSALTRDILTAVAAHKGASGQELIAYLEKIYNDQITNAAFYTNIDTLVACGLVEKGERDGRTNEYQLTIDGREALEADLEWRTDVLTSDSKPESMT